MCTPESRHNVSLLTLLDRVENTGVFHCLGVFRLRFGSEVRVSSFEASEPAVGSAE